MQSSFFHQASRLIALKRLAKSADSSTDIGFDTLRSLLSKNPFIIEVGSFTGGDTEKFALAFPEAEIHGFEADKENFSKAWERMRHYPNVHLTCAACSNCFGVSSFITSDGDSRAAGSLLHPTTHLQKFPGVTFATSDLPLVLTLPLSSYLSALDFRDSIIDLLWLDVQGAELLVLEGAGVYVEKCRYIYLEVSKIALYEGGATYADVDLFLKNKGFDQVKKYLVSESNAVGNALYERSQPFT